MIVLAVLVLMSTLEILGGLAVDLAAITSGVDPFQAKMSFVSTHQHLLYGLKVASLGAGILIVSMAPFPPCWTVGPILLALFVCAGQALAGMVWFASPQASGRIQRALIGWVQAYPRLTLLLLAGVIVGNVCLVAMAATI